MASSPKRLILASRSPRRRDLLTEAGLSFEVVDVAVDETPWPGALPHALAAELAFLKASTAARAYPDDLVLGADTVVALGERIFGKPTDEADNRAMLEALSHRWHEVHTGFSLVWHAGSKFHREVVTTMVRFRLIGASEIQAYVRSGEGMDKAGGYAIQGGARGFVAALDGGFANVVGLPVPQVLQALEAARSWTIDG